MLCIKVTLCEKTPSAAAERRWVWNQTSSNPEKQKVMWGLRETGGDRGGGGRGVMGGRGSSREAIIVFSVDQDSKRSPIPMMPRPAVDQVRYFLCVFMCTRRSAGCVCQAPHPSALFYESDETLCFSRAAVSEGCHWVVNNIFTNRVSCLI